MTQRTRVRRVVCRRGQHVWITLRNTATVREQRCRNCPAHRTLYRGKPA